MFILYDMWDWPFLKGTLWMWAAIFGDILIVLGLWKGTTLLVSSVQFESSGYKGYLILIVLSFVASVFLEWAAIFLDLWLYTSSMPVVTIFNYEVGLSPIFQITFSCWRLVFTWQINFTLNLNHRIQLWTTQSLSFAHTYNSTDILL